MSFIKRKHLKILFCVFFSLILTNCQLKDPSKLHGIKFLKNREEVLKINEFNKNDVVKLLGKPHTVSLSSDNKWIYFERTITRGKLQRLGRNVLKDNNILELNFDDRGVLVSKKFYSKEDINKIKIAEDKTDNTVSKKSFVSNMLGSIRQKMYGNR